MILSFPSRVAFAPETVERFRELLRDKTSIASEGERQRMVERLGANPVDLFGDCDDERLLEALKILDEPGNF